jgi:hypothetical protein
MPCSLHAADEGITANLCANCSLITSEHKRSTKLVRVNVKHHENN